MRATVAELQGDAREGGAEGSSRQTCDQWRMIRQRGRVRAASVRANAKPKVHPDAPGRVGWRAGKVQDLTRGDLWRESAGGVSRGRSSEDPRRDAEGGRSEGPKQPTGTAEIEPSPVRSVEPRGGDNCGRPSRNEEGPRVQPVQPTEGPTGKLRALRRRSWEVATAGCGKPHVRWCGSPDGRNPVRATRS